MPALETILAGLDAAQVAAVTTPSTLVAVIAGAGSGKTRVLTSRIAYRLATGTADADHTLALTFTREAAGELRRRLRRSGVRDHVEAGTFHAVALAPAPPAPARTSTSRRSSVADDRATSARRRRRWRSGRRAGDGSRLGGRPGRRPPTSYVDRGAGRRASRRDPAAAHRRGAGRLPGAQAATRRRRSRRPADARRPRADERPGLGRCGALALPTRARRRGPGPQPDPVPAARADRREPSRPLPRR